MAILDNSARSITKATYTSITVPARRLGDLAHAHVKANMLRSLQLRPGEVALVREHAAAQPRPHLRDDRADPVPDEVWQAVTGFEPPAVGALAPAAAEVGDLSAAHLLLVGQAVLNFRTSQLRSAPAGDVVRSGEVDAAVGKSLVNFAVGALKGFTGAVKVAPIGMLHLERVEMAPAGVERGELLATIPLAPGEQTSVVQKEWSVTDGEFSTIVTDALEEYSEKGVTEKTELAEATESQ